MRKTNGNTKSSMITGEVRIKNQVPLSPAKHAKRDRVEDLAVSVLTGSDFKVIKNPELYQQEYQRRISDENRDLNLQPRLSDYGVFKISEIHPPSVEGERLVFFARNRHNVPYKVTCELTDRKPSYVLLPYESACPEKMQTK